MAVIVGVAAEFFLPATGYVAIGDWPGLAVALGVAGEIAFARRGAHLSGVVSDRLMVRLAQAERLSAIADQHAATAWARTVRIQQELAEANLEVERLKADNLSLQTVLLPRHVGLIGIDQDPPANRWFAGLERWAGTKVLIQVAPGDPEVQNLANEIAIVLSRFGWIPEIIDERRSGISMNTQEGVSVLSPSSYKAWDPANPEQQRFSTLGQAAVALAHALTSAGLGIGSRPVSGASGLGIVVDVPPDSDAAKTQYGRFDPPLDGVYVQVGSRPVAATVAWIKAGRPDELGNATAMPAEQRK